MEHYQILLQISNDNRKCKYYLKGELKWIKEILNVLIVTTLGMLSSVFQDLWNAQSAEVLIFIGKIVKAKDLFAGEADKGIEVMDGIAIKTKSKSGFLYCPRCGLRKPKNEIFGYYGGYCPSCGTRMVDEGPLHFTSQKVKYTRQLSYHLLKQGMTNKNSSYV